MSLLQHCTKHLTVFQAKLVILKNLSFSVIPILWMGDDLSTSIYHWNNCWTPFSSLIWWDYHSIQCTVMCILVHKINGEILFIWCYSLTLLSSAGSESVGSSQIKCYFRKSVRGTFWLCYTFSENEKNTPTL